MHWSSLSWDEYPPSSWPKSWQIKLNQLSMLTKFSVPVGCVGVAVESVFLRRPNSLISPLALVEVCVEGVSLAHVKAIRCAPLSLQLRPLLGSRDVPCAATWERIWAMLAAVGLSNCGPRVFLVVCRGSKVMFCKCHNYCRNLCGGRTQLASRV